MSEEMHLQKNGSPHAPACGERGIHRRTWNLCEVTCEPCKDSTQFRDSQAYGDIGSAGRELGYGRTGEQE